MTFFSTRYEIKNLRHPTPLHLPGRFPLSRSASRAGVRFCAKAEEKRGRRSIEPENRPGKRLLPGNPFHWRDTLTPWIIKTGGGRAPFPVLAPLSLKKKRPDPVGTRKSRPPLAASPTLRNPSVLDHRSRRFVIAFATSRSFLKFATKMSSIRFDFPRAGQMTRKENLGETLAGNWRHCSSARISPSKCLEMLFLCGAVAQARQSFLNCSIAGKAGAGPLEWLPLCTRILQAVLESRLRAGPSNRCIINKLFLGTCARRGPQAELTVSFGWEEWKPWTEIQF